MAALSETVRHIRRIMEVKEVRDCTDRQVPARFTAERSDSAFAELVRRHGSMVFATCRRLLRREQDAEDVFQAVFLVLARKACSIRQRDNIGAWLYQVAYRLALRARTTADRQQRRLLEVAAAASAAGPKAREVGSAASVDEEVQRLPERLRTPLVLCYIEGRTQAEAAQLLGTTADAVNSRLKRARDLLRERLAPAGAVVLLSGSALEAALPPELVRATVRAALSFITSKQVTASALAVVLAKGALRTMLIQKLKGLYVAALGVALLSATFLLTAADRVDSGQRASSKNGTGAAQPQSGEAGKPPRPGKQPERSCIVLWMSGGPSQIDTFDPKPGVANGGPFRSIKTAVKDMDFSENLPLLAQQAKHLTVIRSLTHGEGDHARGTYLMRTGRSVDDGVPYPSFACVLAKELGKTRPGLPWCIGIGMSPWLAPAAYGPGFLGARYAPVSVRVARGFGPDSISLPPAKAFEPQAKGKGETLRKKVARAFDLSEESQEVRAAYGPDPFGQGCLLARRLVEAGVPVVEVDMSGWDSHSDNFNTVQKRSAILDSAFASLLKDLHDHKRLSSTLIVWMGEFGRTPRINANMGRDHWPRNFSVALAGCGLKGGQVIGQTAADGSGVLNRPVTPPELLATIYQALGINPAKEYEHEDRKIPLVPPGTEAVTEALR